MKYTIEDVKRLVPEATKVATMLNCTYFNIGSRVFVASQPDGQILLSTRRQLEIARGELNAIATQDDFEMALDPTWAKRIAEHALGAINKEGEA